MDQLRMNGKELLSILLKHNDNINMLERYIRSAVTTDEEYEDVLYEISTEIVESHNRKKTIQDALTVLKNGQIGWKHPVFQPFIERVMEEDIFLTSPLEIEEGVLECRCGSKRTISFQRQTRSADEGCTTFAQCVECGKKWRHNN